MNNNLTMFNIVGYLLQQHAACYYLKRDSYRQISPASHEPVGEKKSIESIIGLLEKTHGV